MHEDRQSRIAALFQSYRENLPTLLAELESAWTTLQKGWDAELAAEFDRKVHSLAGSAATFELTEIGTAASELEHCFKPVLDMEYDTSHSRWSESSQLFAKLKELIESSQH
ncbi:MAG: Hpt domain-containing protein [Sulfuriflexus sp.]|nr:Hpt domain-containing protein [Sulfuriflexus sp.]